MSEHRRKPPSRGRRASGSSGRRAAPPPGPPTGPGQAGPPPGAGGPAYGSRAEARRAAQQGGRRRQEPEGKKRFIDYPRHGKQGVRRWLPSWRHLLGAALLFMAMAVGLFGIAYAMVSTPNPNEAAQQQTNVYYWADGSRMVVHGGGGDNRQNVGFEQLPDHLVNSVVSAENHTFWEDSGVDPMGIARAVVNMARGGETQSGSTITQQYVKNNYLSQEQTLERKFKELMISIKVGRDEKKEVILEGYLNTAYFGRGAYGIQAASQAYYGKNATDLDANESAFMTSLLKGPELHDPAGGTQGEVNAERNTNNAIERWKYVWNRKVELGYATAAERAENDEFPMPRQPTPAMDLAGQTGYLVQMADAYLVNEERVTPETLARGGLSIHTTFEKDKVEMMEGAVNSVLEQLDPEEREENQHVQFTSSAVKPGDGAVVAVYGGPSATEHFINNATRADVQVGSTFKPFVLAAALRDGIRDAGKGPDQGPEDRTRISAESKYYSENGLLIHNYDGSVWEGEDDDGEPFNWEQRNYEDQSQGDITLREAMEVSANSPFVQLSMDIGVKEVGKAAIDAGLPEGQLGEYNDTVPTFALGVSTVSSMNMANGYATFAAHGEQAEIYTVTKVDGRDGNIFTHEKQVKRTFDSAVADTVTDVLAGVVERGSGTAAQEIGKPAAAKTGTTDKNISAWFAGYTPHLSTAVGMYRYDQTDSGKGFQSMRGTGGMDNGVTGGSFPAQVWVEFMKGATADDEPTEFAEARDDGEVVYGGGAESPAPPPSDPPEEEEEESSEPSDPPEEEEEDTPEPDPSDDPDPSPDPSDDCRRWDPNCNDDGGQSGGPGGPGGPGGNGGPGGTGGPGGDSGGPGGDQGSPGDPADPSMPEDPVDPGDDEGGGWILGASGGGRD
ncbi:transglycosylase domain-containing protein [Streptomyces bohaiensis]|uniref:transglycosylase domain-containing protein n=1 Tax=Streptomyces bohaiensis TaxID=1431344 RepID=UPI003B7EA648